MTNHSYDQRQEILDYIKKANKDFSFQRSNSGAFLLSGRRSFPDNKNRLISIRFYIASLIVVLLLLWDVTEIKIRDYSAQDIYTVIEKECKLEFITIKDLQHKLQVWFGHISP